MASWYIALFRWHRVKHFLRRSSTHQGAQHVPNTSVPNVSVPNVSDLNPSNREDDGNSEEPSNPPPISRLPPEILTLIFFAFQSLHDAKYYYKWTSILHVSQSWRQLVLETNSLWGSIMLPYSRGSLRWSIVSLERSGSAKLDITIYTRNPKESLYDFILEVLSQMHRIRSLDL
ncbi:hypothetical protein BDN72DRAFT_829254, partial [Pluteus cervinus]